MAISFLSSFYVTHTCILSPDFFYSYRPIHFSIFKAPLNFRHTILSPPLSLQNALLPVKKSHLQDLFIRLLRSYLLAFLFLVQINLIQCAATRSLSEGCFQAYCLPLSNRPPPFYFEVVSDLITPSGLFPSRLTVLRYCCRTPSFFFPVKFHFSVYLTRLVNPS